jgi:hypothetical protein
MIPPFQHPDTRPSTPPNPTPPSRPAPARHTDYDRHPLPVESLGHYIEHRPGDDRFHVS